MSNGLYIEVATSLAALMRLELDRRDREEPHYCDLCKHYHVDGDHSYREVCDNFEVDNGIEGDFCANCGHGRWSHYAEKIRQVSEESQAQEAREESQRLGGVFEVHGV